MRETLTQLQQDTLTAVMDRGPAGPITGKELAGVIGLKPRSSGKEGADMRSIINALRVKGYPICADGRGYWWPANDHELSAYITSFQGRIDDQQRACDGMKQGFDKVAKAPEEVLPPKVQKKIVVELNNLVHFIDEDKVADFLTANPAARRV